MIKIKLRFQSHKKTTNNLHSNFSQSYFKQLLFDFLINQDSGLLLINPGYYFEKMLLKIILD